MIKVGTRSAHRNAKFSLSGVLSITLRGGKFRFGKGKPSPRKLEAHEVIAKLKARKP
jgi:hypothetical protein